MSSLPGQSIQDWEKTLKKVLALEPEHISAYSLILEEGTPMGDHPDRYPPIPEEEADRCMYHLTRELMAQNGYDRYEISNYAKMADYADTMQCTGQEAIMWDLVWVRLPW